MTVEIAKRVGDRPLLTCDDVPPAQPGFEVVSVLNPAAARIGDKVALLVRVAERPRSDVDPPADARTLDLSGLHPKLVALPGGYKRDDVVRIAMRDPEASSPELRYVPVFLPKDLPGLDTSDPRGVRFTHPRLGRKATFLTQVSHLRCAWSDDGLRFVVDDEPSIAPTTDLEEFGCEDPRAARIDGLWHVTYVSVSRVGITTSLAVTEDFHRYQKLGTVLPPDQKDLVLFPEKWRGGPVAFTRPMPSSFGHVLGIWIAMPKGALPWGLHRPLVLPRQGKWDERQTGAGTVPFLSANGWVEIYHGVDSKLRYSLGAVLLDRNDPSKVLGRSDEPILRPEMPYETHGVFPDVIFTCGHVPMDDAEERIRVYYGAADSVVAAADFEVRDILDSLRPPGPRDSRFGHPEPDLV
ncbi:MAG TPA: glycosidase [Candidatus Limnocylindria bacterium]